jgi:hypothetical protein
MACSATPWITATISSAGRVAGKELSRDIGDIERSCNEAETLSCPSFFITTGAASYMCDDDTTSPGSEIT